MSNIEACIHTRSRWKARRSTDLNKVVLFIFRFGENVKYIMFLRLESLCGFLDLAGAGRFHCFTLYCNSNFRK